MWTVFVLIGTLSIATHLALLNVVIVPQQAAELKSAFSSRSGIDWFDASMSILILVGCLLMDYIVLSAFVKGFISSGTAFS